MPLTPNNVADIADVRDRIYKANLTLNQSLTTQIASRVNLLTNQIVQEINYPKGRYKIKDFKELMENEPLSKACVELKGLRATTSFGDYEHADKETQAFIRSNFETMRGSIKEVVKNLASALPFGFAVAEVVYTTKMSGHHGQWRVETINCLDPERVSFAGCKGNITHVVYHDGDGKKKYIDYRKCIHVANGMHLSNPFGSAEARRAMPYYKAKNLLFSEMMVAGKNCASGILLAQADSNDKVQMLGGDNLPVKNADGTSKVVSAVEALMYQLQGLESSGIIATDLKNRVTPLLIPSGDAFWNYAVSMLKKEILLSFLTPSLIWDDGSFGGLGNTGVSGNHKSTLDANIAAVVDQMQEEILDKVVRFLLVHNRPPSVWKQGFGSFQAQAFNDPNFLASQASNLIAAIGSQILPTADLDVINALREALGVPTVNERQAQDLIQKQIQMQAMQQQPAPDPNAQAAPQEQGAGFTRSGSLNTFNYYLR